MVVGKGTSNGVANFAPLATSVSLLWSSVHSGQVQSMHATNSPQPFKPHHFCSVPSRSIIWHHCSPSIQLNNCSECLPLTLTSSLTVDANMSHTSGTTVSNYNRAGDKTVDNASRDAKFEKNLADYKRRRAEEQSAAAKLRSDTLLAGRNQEKVTGKPMNFDVFFEGRRVIQLDEWIPSTSGSTHQEGPLTFTGTRAPLTSALVPASTATPSPSVAVQLTDDCITMH
jgi:hypothetical protein